MPWYSTKCKNGPGNCYMVDPTMPQLMEAVADALNFTVANANGITEANSIIIRLEYKGIFSFAWGVAV